MLVETVYFRCRNRFCCSPYEQVRSHSYHDGVSGSWPVNLRVRCWIAGLTVVHELHQSLCAEAQIRLLLVHSRCGRRGAPRGFAAVPVACGETIGLQGKRSQALYAMVQNLTHDFTHGEAAKTPNAVNLPCKRRPCRSGKLLVCVRGTAVTARALLVSKFLLPPPSVQGPTQLAATLGP